ncbi:hypothetical protein [Candidatus Poriferisodalis sp.]|uniref:hypothetical protein n=1 Tax=Candidatus Poriferisodalis sp. TaxID=3101277 RepID=UPI003B011BE4
MDVGIETPKQAAEGRGSGRFHWAKLALVVYLGVLAFEWLSHSRSQRHIVILGLVIAGLTYEGVARIRRREPRAKDLQAMLAEVCCFGLLVFEWVPHSRSQGYLAILGVALAGLVYERTRRRRAAVCETGSAWRRRD